MYLISALFKDDYSHNWCFRILINDQTYTYSWPSFGLAYENHKRAIKQLNQLLGKVA